MQTIARLAVTLLLAAPVAAGATTILDGSFEAKGAATPVTNYCYDGLVTPGGRACATSPWVGGGVIRDGSAAWGNTSSPFGTYYAFVQGRQVISQSFTATESGTGIITWSDANRRNLGGAQSYNVSIFNGTTDTLIGTYTSVIGTAFNARTSSSFNLVNGRTYTLRYTGLATSDRTAFIDNVAIAVTPPAVPEPSTWAMLIAGFGLVGFAARRRRATVVSA